MTFCHHLKTQATENTMVMKLLICCTVVAAAWAMPKDRGACVIQCSPGLGIYEGLNLADCPEGQACHSTGCGAMCVHVTKRAIHCRPVLCDMYCVHGFAKDENGCEHCSCSQPSIIKLTTKPSHHTTAAGCRPVLCEMYCQHGFATDKDGCQYCTCNNPVVDLLTTG